MKNKEYYRQKTTENEIAEELEPSATAEPESKPEKVFKGAIVNCFNINVRKKPDEFSTEYIKTARAGTYVKCYDDNYSEFLKVEFPGEEGKFGYIKRKYIEEA